MDFNTETAQLELERVVEQLQKKWKVNNRTMSFLLYGLFGEYEVKALARDYVNGEEKR